MSNTQNGANTPATAPKKVIVYLPEIEGETILRTLCDGVHKYKGENKRSGLKRHWNSKQKDTLYVFQCRRRQEEFTDAKKFKQDKHMSCLATGQNIDDDTFLQSQLVEQDLNQTVEENQSDEHPATVPSNSPHERTEDAQPPMSGVMPSTVNQMVATSTEDAQPLLSGVMPSTVNNYSRTI